MRNWTGVERRTRSVGNGILEMRNAGLRTDYELQRRPALQPVDRPLTEPARLLFPADGLTGRREGAALAFGGGDLSLQPDAPTSEVPPEPENPLAAYLLAGDIHTIAPESVSDGQVIPSLAPADTDSLVNGSPSVTTSGGVNWIEFDGTNQGLRVGPSDGWMEDTVHGFLVVRGLPTSGSSSNFILSQALLLPGQDGGGHWIFQQGAAQIWAYRTANRTAVAGSNVLSGTAVIEYQRTAEPGGELNIRVNGLSAAPVDPLNNSGPSSTQLWIARGWSIGGAFYAFDFTEHFATKNRIWEGADLTAIRSYFATKYGVLT